MTMKMMINTSSTSIIGVMLISDLGPLPDPPTAIAIEITPYELSCSDTSFRRRSRALLLLLRCLIILDLFGQQADLIDARGTQVVDDGDHFFIPRPRIGADEHHFVDAVSEHVPDAAG